jgi:hypothetical protein
MTLVERASRNLAHTRASTAPAIITTGSWATKVARASANNPGPSPPYKALTDTATRRAGRASSP